MTDHLHHPSVLRNCRIWDFPALIGLIGCLIPILSKDIAKLGMETMGREQLLNLLKQLCASAVTISGPEEGCGTYRHPFRCHRVSLTIVSACKCAAWRRQLQALLQRQVPERSLRITNSLCSGKDCMNNANGASMQGFSFWQPSNTHSDRSQAVEQAGSEAQSWGFAF